MSRKFQFNTGSFDSATKRTFCIIMLAIGWTAQATLPVGAQTTEQTPADPSTETTQAATNTIAEDEQKEILEGLLANTKLTGLFTVTGKPLTDLTEETYEIESVTKIGTGTTWSILCRIAYGKNDLKAPVPVNIEWAGKTPVIVLDKVTIPLMGTFSARVLFHDGRYAGTWQHDEVGGHLFGTFQKKSDDEKSAPLEKADD